MKTTEELVKLVYDVLDEHKGEDITILDIAKLTPISDYFVVVSGGSQNMVQSLSDYVQDALAKEGKHAKNVEGYGSAEWILLDYEDFVVHVFMRDQRKFFNIERIWQDARKMNGAEL